MNPGQPALRTASAGRVPVIDLGLDRPVGADGRAAVATAIGAALSGSGFFVAIGHGVPDAVLTGLHGAARVFFGQDEAARAAIAADPLDPLQRGYSPGDRLRMFSANRLGERHSPGEPLAGPNRWPALPGFQDAYLACYEAIETMVRGLLQRCAVALDLPADWFDGKFGQHMSPLTANYYPVRPEAGLPGARLRNEPHTDFSALTVLYQNDGPDGLQVQVPGGRWLDVPPTPGTLVVNLGQLMARWTNDRWAATPHRVINPRPEHRDLDRISIAFFCLPSPDTLVECLPTCPGPARHRPILARDYLVARARRAYVGRPAPTGGTDA
jgi:isopenicillin N synthase-like dioxygenase